MDRKKLLAIKRHEVAILELEDRIQDRKEDIDRMEKHIALQKEQIEKLKEQLKGE